MSQLMKNLKETYAYVIEGNEMKKTFSVCRNDIIENADGEIDCPLDAVLSKHHLTFGDLNGLSPTRALFVKYEGEQETVLNEISLNINL
ncbi:hypothetical protein [Pisciglobus halotolerans]|uniref:Uncharacterized protein n=1 Tax=Pisciglobus halotolerans TaxID=745365 RepID=A0A1I3CJW9_9LACT|nr:hypothetical protein [Pisciglobus halotolerans]SFH74775.1 hypothetical protein SAMN04489868_11915 [Pisciglobus halotolerans]